MNLTLILVGVLKIAETKFILRNVILTFFY